MKKFTQIVLANLALVVLLTCFNTRLFANGAANGNAGVILQLNGGAKTIYKVYDGAWGNDGGTGWYDIQGATTFSGANLGNLNSLTLNGMAIVGWTDNGDFVSGQIQYKIWLNGTSEPGSVTGSFNVGGYGSACSVQDVQSSSGSNRKVGWDASSVDLLSGLTPGVYNLKIYPYGQMRYNCGSYNQVNNAAVTATFNVNPTVTFNANGGSGSMSTENVNYNTATALNANTFTYSGYSFNGWNTAANGSGTSYANSANVTFTANTTLYAQWLPYPTISSFKVGGTASTSGYVGQTLQIIGTSFSSGTNTVTFNGGSSISATYISSTEVDVVVPPSATTGLVALTTAGNLTAGVSYTVLGYISNASTDWNTGTTWLGNSVPTASANVTIANAVTVTTAVTNAAGTVTVNGGGSLAFSASGALSATTVTNNGTLTMSAGTLTIAAGGTLTNNTNGTSFSGGTVSFSGAGTVGGTFPIIFNNLLSISGVVNLTTAPTINGTLTINTLGGVGTNSPYYGASSTLFYNAATTVSVPYHRSYEWVLGTTSSAAAGYPNNVTIGSSSIACVLDLDNSGTLQMGGVLTIGVASGSSSSLQMNESTTPFPLTVVGGVTVNVTGTLLLGNLVSSYVGDLYVKGSFTNNGTLNTNNRAVFFTGTSAQTISGTALNTSSGSTNNFPYLFISNTSASVSLGSNVTVSATLTISSGATLADGGYILSVSGTSLVNNGTHSGAGKIKLTGSSAGISGTGTFQNLEISLGSNSNIATVSSSFSVSGNLTVTQGRVQPSGAGRVITMSGTTQAFSVANTNGFIYGTDNSPNDLSLTINSGSATTYSGTTNTTTDDGNKFYNITVNGTLILSSGILCKYGSFTVSGTIQINSGGYIQSNNTTNSASASSNKAASYSSGNLIYNNGGSYAATDFEWPTSNSPTNVTIQNASTNVTLNDSKSIAGTLTLNVSTNYLILNGNTFTLNGAVTGSGTLTGSSTSNLIIAGGTIGTIKFTAGSAALNNLTVNGGSVILGTALTMSGTVLVAGGKFEVGAITQIIPAFNMTSGTLQLDASSTVRFTGTYSASSGSTLNAYANPSNLLTNSTISLEVTNNTTRFPGSGVTVNNGVSFGPITTCMGNLVMALPNPANSVTWKSAGSTVLIYGVLSLNSGLIVTTTNSDVLSAASVTNAGGAFSYVSGPLGISATTTSAVTFPIGKGGNYRPVTFAYTTANAGNAVVIEQFESSFPGTIPTDVSFSRFGTRYYNIIQYQTGYAYTVGLNNGGVTPTGTVKIIRRDGASVTTNANATSFSSPTYTTSSSYTATTYLSNDVSLVETAIPLTVTASAQSKTYGAALSPLAASYSVSGLVGSDNISSVTLTNSNTANGNSPVTDVPGTYTITPSAAVFSSGVNGAYNITYNTGTLTVNAGTAGTWIGIASTNFNAVANWQSYSTPISSTNVSIGTGTTYLPILTATSSINNLSLASGTTIGLSGQTLTINGAISGSGTITSTSASSLTIGGTAGTLNFTSGNNTIKNLTLNSSSSATLGTQLNIVGGSTLGVVTIGTGATLTTGGNLVLKSDANGTARIDQVLGSISGNVTVERYITAKAGRRYSFIGSPVSQTVRNAWQQQIYVTGSGTGGTPCGSTSGNGGTTDKYNSNGFDATINNANSILTYTATTTNNSHYVGIANTGVSLSPGTGYSVNIRGDRSSGNTNCTNQLTTTSPMAPEAVTLSASGTVTTGDLAVALNDKTVHTFTLLANPYPSQISFTALRTSNVIINNKMWTFSPFGSGNFTTYANGVIVNGVSGFDNTNGDYIASGQAFFVEANTNGSVTFHESHKTSGVVPNTNYFGVKSDKMIRIGLYNSTNTRLDEALVRYNNYGSKDYNNEWDATSLSLSSQALVTFKGTNKLAIATHPLSFSIDTTQLGVAIKAGSYSLAFSQLESIDSFQNITLVDNYLGVSVNVRHSSAYSFNVTSDTASKGTKRFKIILSGANPLAVNFVSINATQNTNGVAVEWQVANEQPIASYIIERSTDAVHFTTVNTVAAKGTSSYNTQDASVPVGAAKLYYRIKSLGFDGAYKYSTIATVVTHDSRFVGLTIYPNPVQRKLNITSKSVMIGSTCTVKITTTAGTVAFDKSKVAYTGNALSLDVAKLAAGVYMVELTDAKGNKLVDKFIKE